MKKVGFIDYYLDEWHANKYPEWLKNYSNGEYEVAYAYGEIDSPNGKTNADWAKEFGVELCHTIGMVVEKSDVLIVLSPDNPECHERLCKEPLASGKPTYIDKTFAPDKPTAMRIFDMAEAGKTPIFSSSALRFADEYQAITPKSATTVDLFGPGLDANYLIHLAEPMVYLMGNDVTRIRMVGGFDNIKLQVEFAGGKTGFLTMPKTWDIGFEGHVHHGGGYSKIVPDSDFFKGLITAMIKFFDSKVPPVEKADTIALMGIIGAAEKAIAKPDEWVEI